MNVDSIGVRNESSLHAAIKQWYRRPGDALEVEIAGYVVDIVRGELLIEVQTGNFSTIRKKLRALLEHHRVRLVYPVATRKWLVRVDQVGGNVLRRRKSPKQGTLDNLFDELIRIPDLPGHSGFCLEVVLVCTEEIRCDDGRGSWRRAGVSIIDRRLIEVVDSVCYDSTQDYLSFLPNDLPKPFSNNMLAACASVPVRKARKMTYCLRKMDAIREVGRNGRELLFAIR